jgi:hypothetical protein
VYYPHTRNSITLHFLLFFFIAHIPQVNSQSLRYVVEHASTRQAPTHRTHDIDHLGIVAGIVDDIGLVEVIDRQVGTPAQADLSAGQVVTAMLLHGLGVVSAPRYLVHAFFRGKASAPLLALGSTPDQLHADQRGRGLDNLDAAD